LRAGDDDNPVIGRAHTVFDRLSRVAIGIDLSTSCDYPQMRYLLFPGKLPDGI
jgi:hypothetical protein